MKLPFYPYDFEYKIRDNKTYLYLYSKLDDGKKLCVIHQYNPYFYADIKNLNKEVLLQKFNTLELQEKGDSLKIIKVEETEKELLGKRKPFLKISVNYPKAVPLISKELSSLGIECYEKDILYTHRVLKDLSIIPMMLTEAEGEYLKEEYLKEENKESSRISIPIFKADKITPLKKETTKWKILATDIETYAIKKEIDPEKNPILMISFYAINENNEEIKKVITWKEFPHHLDYLEVKTDEASMIESARDFIREFQPDIITGYFSDGFDFPYLKHRADKFKIKLDLGLDNSSINTGKKAEFREGETRITGMLHLDIFKFIRNIFGKNLKTDSYSLDAVSSELLGHKKHVVNLDELSPLWDQNSPKLEEFCKYNLHDSLLTWKLTDKLLSDVIEFTNTIGLPPFDIIRMKFSRLVESFIMKRAIAENVIAPNKPDDKELNQRMKESIEGAFVFEPTPGLYQNIVVFDFRSLYPTIISAHNIGPESFRCSCCPNILPVPEKDNYWFCQKEKKFIPKVLEELINLRAEFKRQLKEAKAKGEDTRYLDARSYTVKVMANSFYGYLGFYGARWYCIECAASTTAYARNYIKSTINKAEQDGFKVIYADTDSCFMLLGDKTKEDATKFMEEINETLPGQMELECEGYYPRGIFVAIKGTEKGAKKKYALISENKKLKITGFETVRRNWSAIAKEVQEAVLKLVLEDKTQEALNYVKLMIKELKEGQIPLNKLIIKTQLTRELDNYSSQGPHVAVALRMKENGERIYPGLLIEYIITKGTGLIRSRAKIPKEVKEGEYDADYYLNNQLIPAVASIFAVLGYAEDDLFKESSQKGLGQFF